jgi:hypothetical protein
MEGKVEIIAGEETFLQFLLRKSKLTLNQPQNSQVLGVWSKFGEFNTFFG